MKEKPGYIEGKYFTTYVERVKQLKREKKFEGAIALLKNLLDATEKESIASGCGVAPWYYEQLAILYKKKGLPEEERNVLVRFSKQKHSPGVKPAKLLTRLEKLING